MARPEPVDPRPGPLPAQRFARPTLGQPPDRPVRALAAATVLALLLGGIPVGLVMLAGAPVPTSVPDAQLWLRRVDVLFLLDVLVVIAWLAWLQFAVSVVVEVVAAVRGGVLAAPVPFAGPSQRLARTLVAAVLLSAALGGQMLPAAAAPPPASQPTATVAPSEEPTQGTAEGPAAAAALQPTGTGGGAPSGATGAMSADAHTHDVVTADVAPELTGLRVYTVHPPQGRHHDNLWHIAERLLGDGRRYQEIYDLNAGRVQPDGATLELARLIQPGWQLVMPDDAVAVSRVAAPAPDVVAPVEQPPVDPSALDVDPADAAPGGPPDQTIETPGSTSTTAADWAHRDRTAVSQHVESYLGGGLLAAGVIGLVAARRRGQGGARPQDAPADPEEALRLCADERTAALVDRAMRLLSQRCADLGRPLPGIYAAIADAHSLQLRLSPGDPDAPAPWEPVDGGGSWLLRSTSLPRATLPAASPYPYLVSLGTDDGEREVLIDLAAAGGAISIAGSPAVAQEVVSALAVQLALQPWSSQARVTGCHLPPGVAAAVGPRLSLASTVSEALVGAGSGPAPSATTDVITGRPAPGSERDLRMVVIGGPMEPHQQRDVSAALASESQLGLLAVGEIEGARWRLSVDDAGLLSAGVLGLVVRANRLGAAQGEAVAALLATAASPSPGPLARQRPDVPASPAAVDDADWPGAPARVGVLGPALFRAPGRVDAERRVLVEDIVLYLATHTTGVHPSVLGAAVWPRGVSPEVCEAAVARSRDWLGTTADGSYRLGTTADGRLQLRDVVVDLDVLHALLTRSRQGGDADAEASLLRRALRLVRGEVLQPRPMSRFTWLIREPLEQRTNALVVDAAHRLARLVLAEDPLGASEAARAGLRISPGAAACWQDLLTAEHLVGGRPAVDEAAGQMRLTLSQLGIDPPPQTLALLEELSPRTPVAG